MIHLIIFRILVIKLVFFFDVCPAVDFQKGVVIGHQHKDAWDFQILVNLPQKCINALSWLAFHRVRHIPVHVVQGDHKIGRSGIRITAAVKASPALRGKFQEGLHQGPEAVRQGKAAVQALEAQQRRFPRFKRTFLVQRHNRLIHLLKLPEQRPRFLPVRHSCPLPAGFFNQLPDIPVHPGQNDFHYVLAGFQDAGVNAAQRDKIDAIQQVPAPAGFQEGFHAFPAGIFICQEFDKRPHDRGLSHAPFPDEGNNILHLFRFRILGRSLPSWASAGMELFIPFDNLINHFPGLMILPAHKGLLDFIRAVKDNPLGEKLVDFQHSFRRLYAPAVFLHSAHRRFLFISVPRFR
ncbi:MAG: hypothetical protein HFF84_03240 [Oscillibacter sp.]|nr:hypothetical protein [Oscillibacter sp.]